MKQIYTFVKKYQAKSKKKTRVHVCHLFAGPRIQKYFQIKKCSKIRICQIDTF